jgi:hypothetical protein
MGPSTTWISICQITFTVSLHVRNPCCHCTYPGPESGRTARASASDEERKIIDWWLVISPCWARHPCQRINACVTARMGLARNVLATWRVRRMVQKHCMLHRRGTRADTTSSLGDDERCFSDWNLLPQVESSLWYLKKHTSSGNRTRMIHEWFEYFLQSHAFSCLTETCCVHYISECALMQTWILGASCVPLFTRFFTSLLFFLSFS